MTFKAKFILAISWLAVSIHSCAAWSANHIPLRTTFAIKANQRDIHQCLPGGQKLGLMSNSYYQSNSLVRRATADDMDGDEEEEIEEKLEDEDQKLPIGARIKSYFLQSKKDDGLSFKQRLAKMGVATVLSYGMISNMSYAILIAISWYLFSVQTKVSPLFPGQWKPFLAVYASFWVFNNIIRPLRLGLSIAIAPSLDKLVLFFQRRLKVSKPIAVTVTVIFVNVIGTTLLMVGGISLAAMLAGAPIFPPKK